MTSRARVGACLHREVLLCLSDYPPPLLYTDVSTANVSSLLSTETTHVFKFSVMSCLPGILQLREYRLNCHSLSQLSSVGVVRLADWCLPTSLPQPYRCRVATLCGVPTPLMSDPLHTAVSPSSLSVDASLYVFDASLPMSICLQDVVPTFSLFRVDEFWLSDGMNFLLFFVTIDCSQ